MSTHFMQRADGPNFLFLSFTELGDDTDRILVSRSVLFSGDSDISLPVETALTRDESRDRYREALAAGYVPSQSPADNAALASDLMREPARPVIILPEASAQDRSTGPQDNPPSGKGGKRVPPRSPVRPLLPSGGAILEPMF